MENNVKNRAKYALEKLGMSCYSVAKFCNKSERTLYDQINGNSKIGVATLCALLEYCPDISAEWLLRGVGDMLIGGCKKQASVSQDASVSELKDTIRRQQREIDGLYERIDELKKGSTTAAISTVHTA